MSDIAIRVAGLSKKYRLGEARSSYQTFREALTRVSALPVRWIKGERQTENTIWALDNVSFEIKHGEAVGIIGRNGAGKSTLLKVLSRITRPTLGRVDLYGRVGSLLEVGTGFHPELTGRENIYLNGAILGMTRREIDRKFEEIVNFAEIEKFLDTPVKYYSSGMYVRLAFAVAAHLEPEILVVDEVLAVGDADFQKKCMGKMGEVAQGGRTVLFVSHNMGAVRSLCTRGILLDHGKATYFNDIVDCVNRYLGSNDRNDLPQINLPIQGDLPIQLTNVKVMNSKNTVVKQYAYDEEIQINFGVNVNTRVSRIYMAFHLHDNEQQTLLFSRDFETDIDRLSKTWLPGDYQYKISIPKCMLIPGTYRLSIHIASSMPPKVINGVNAICPFEVIDNGSVRAQTGFPWIGKMSFFPNWILIDSNP